MSASLLGNWLHNTEDNCPQDKVDLVWKHWTVHSAPAAHTNPLTGCLEQAPRHFRPSGHVHNSLPHFTHVPLCWGDPVLAPSLRSFPFTEVFLSCCFRFCPVHNIWERTNYQRNGELPSSRHFEWGKKIRNYICGFVFFFCQARKQAKDWKSCLGLALDDWH